MKYLGKITDNKDLVTKEYVDNAVAGGGGGLTIDDIYPVGSIYMTVNNVNPSTLFSGTTWQQIQDTFLLAAGSTYSGGATGGEATHTLTESELPTVDGSFTIRRMNSSGTTGQMITATTGKMSKAATSSAVGQGSGWGTSGSIVGDKISMSFGSGSSHNNMPPYLAVYVWKRTA